MKLEITPPSQLHFAAISFEIFVYRYSFTRDARSAKCGIAIVSRPSVRLSVRNVDVPWAYKLDSPKLFARA